MKPIHFLLASTFLFYPSCSFPTGPIDKKTDPLAYIPQCPLPDIDGVWTLTAYYYDWCEGGAFSVSDSVFAIGALEIVKDSAQSYFVALHLRDTTYQFNGQFSSSRYQAPTLYGTGDLYILVYFPLTSSFDGTTLTCTPDQPWGELNTWRAEDRYIPRCGDNEPNSHYGVKLARALD